MTSDWCAGGDVNASPGAHQWLAELPLGDWPTMGVRTDDRPWPRSAPPELLGLRRRVLAEHPECVGVLPGSEAIVAEVAPGGLAELAVSQPDDVCLLAPERGWPLVAGAVLFPSHWRLADKLGRPLAEVHGPVPGYPGVGDRVARFLDRLQPGRAAWRRNVLFHRTGDLYAAERTDGEEWWLRSERQTFRRLSVTGAVLFTIGVDTMRIADVDVDTRRRLAAWLRSLPAAWGSYSGVPVAELVADLDQ